MTDKLKINVTINGVRAVSLQGREAWALQQLNAANDNGCTPIENPGPRWSAYIHKLRKRGFHIVTIREKHGGPFPGEHARYRLLDEVSILDGGKPGNETDTA